MSVKFINYNEMDEFYTIQGVCKLFGMSKEDLKQKCQEYRVNPSRNEIGEDIFSKYDVRRLHNYLYYEDRSHQQEWDPWK